MRTSDPSCKYTSPQSSPIVRHLAVPQKQLEPTGFRGWNRRDDLNGLQEAIQLSKICLTLTSQLCFSFYLFTHLRPQTFIEHLLEGHQHHVEQIKSLPACSAVQQTFLQQWNVLYLYCPIWCHQVDMAIEHRNHGQCV